MKKILFSLVAFFALFTNALATDFEKLQNQNVLIVADDGQGSGVLITKTLDKEKYNFILTCAHVVEAARYEEEVVNASNKQVSKLVKWKPLKVSKEVIKGDASVVEITAEADVLAFDREQDLAILLIRNRDFTDVSAKFAKKGPKIGESVNHAGNYKGRHGFNSVSGGIVSYLKRMLTDDTQWYNQVNNVIYKGSSGGGFYNTEDELVGILAKTGGENIGYVVPLTRINEWTSKNGFAFVVDNDPTMKSKAQIENIPIELNVKSKPTLANPIIVNPFDFKIDFQNILRK